MYDLSRHPFFETWTDPQTGAVSYILKERVAPIQQVFYFTNPGFSPDGEYLLGIEMYKGLIVSADGMYSYGY